MGYLTKWDKAGQAFAKWLDEKPERRAILSTPVFTVKIGDIEVPISDYVEEVTVDNTTYMASMMEISISNHNFSLVQDDTSEMKAAEGGLPHPEWISHTVFQIGNEVEVWAGFGVGGWDWPSEMEDYIAEDGSLKVPLARGVIARHLPDYPEEGVPSFRFKAYTYEWIIMGRQGAERGLNANGKFERDIKKAEKIRTEDARATVQRRGSIVDTKMDLGTYWGSRKAKIKHSDIVKKICDRYDVHLDLGEDIAKTLPGKQAYGYGPSREKGIYLQSRSMNDWAMCKKLAAINGRACWLEYDWDHGIWVMHWHRTALHGTSIHPVFQLDYALNGRGTLLSLSPDYASDDKPEQIVVAVMDPNTGEMRSVLEMDPRNGGLIWRVGGGYMAAAKALPDDPFAPPPRPRTKPKPRVTTGGAAGQLRGASYEATRGSTRHGLLSQTATQGATYQRKVRNARYRRKASQEILAGLRDGSEFWVRQGNLNFSFSVRPGMYAGRDGFMTMMRDVERILTYYKDSFILGRGKIIGNPFLRAGQVNMFGGLLSPRMAGPWEMKQVKHTYSRKDGLYFVEYTASKILSEISVLTQEEKGGKKKSANAKKPVRKKVRRTGPRVTIGSPTFVTEGPVLFVSEADFDEGDTIQSAYFTNEETVVGHMQGAGDTGLIIRDIGISEANIAGPPIDGGDLIRDTAQSEAMMQNAAVSDLRDPFQPPRDPFQPPGGR